MICEGKGKVVGSQFINQCNVMSGFCCHCSTSSPRSLEVTLTTTPFEFGVTVSHSPFHPNKGHQHAVNSRSCGLHFFFLGGVHTVVHYGASRWLASHFQKVACFVRVSVMINQYLGVASHRSVPGGIPHLELT